VERLVLGEPHRNGFLSGCEEGGQNGVHPLPEHVSLKNEVSAGLYSGIAGEIKILDRTCDSGTNLVHLKPFDANHAEAVLRLGRDDSVKVGDVSGDNSDLSRKEGVTIPGREILVHREDQRAFVFGPFEVPFPLGFFEVPSPVLWGHEKVVGLREVVPDLLKQRGAPGEFVIDVVQQQLVGARDARGFRKEQGGLTWIPLGHTQGHMGAEGRKKIGKLTGRVGV
jgi:hypothetical protein